jgi:hypothetical protein
MIPPCENRGQQPATRLRRPARRGTSVASIIASVGLIT